MVQDPSGRIPEDEPVFLLRGRDLLSVQLVLEWAKRYGELGGDPARVKVVRDHAQKMQEWQNNVELKYPDGTTVKRILPDKESVTDTGTKTYFAKITTADSDEYDERTQSIG